MALPAEHVRIQHEQTKTKQWRMKYMKNNAFRYACLASALSLGVALFSIVIFISQTGFLVFKDVSWKEFFFSATWEPFEEKYGAAVFIAGTLYLTFLTLIMCTPIALAIAIFIAEMAPNWLKNIMRVKADDKIPNIDGIKFSTYNRTIVSMRGAMVRDYERGIFYDQRDV